MSGNIMEQLQQKSRANPRRVVLPEAGEEKILLELLENRVPAGVDQAAYVKAAFLSDVATAQASSPLISSAIFRTCRARHSFGNDARGEGLPLSSTI